MGRLGAPALHHVIAGLSGRSMKKDGETRWRRWNAKSFDKPEQTRSINKRKIEVAKSRTEGEPSPTMPVERRRKGVPVT